MADTTTQLPDGMLRTLQYRVIGGENPGIGVSAWLVQKDHLGVEQRSALLQKLEEGLVRLNIKTTYSVSRYELRLSSNGVEPDTLRACVLDAASELRLTPVEL